MSNPFSAIKKVFRKVVKGLKKIALPALAIGAAILTGGAALGILPSVGSILGAGGLGLSAGLTSVLTTAGQGALAGMLTSGISGGNILKGATKGFVIGGVLGAAGQAIKPAASAATALKSAQPAVDSISVTRGAADLGASALPKAADAITVVGRTGTALSAPAVAAAPVAVNPMRTPDPSPVMSAPSPAAGPISSGQGVGSLLSAPFKLLDGLDPYTRSGLIQGIGSGILAGSQAKDQRKADEARQERIAENYRGTGSYYTSSNPTYTPTQQRPRPVWRIDPVTGDAYQTYEGVQ